MADRCPECGLPFITLDDPGGPRDMVLGAGCGTRAMPQYAGAHECCAKNTIARLRAALATTKAQLDRALLLLVKSRDCLDLAIGECQQREQDDAIDGLISKLEGAPNA
jgi:hypothetical protein